MKKPLLILISLFIFSFTQAQQPFITTWEVTAGDLEIFIPADDFVYTYNYTVDFGDGTVLSGQTQSVSHTFENPGIYTVSITGDFPQFYGTALSNSEELMLKTVEQWGDIQWLSMESMFRGCENLTLNATDAPDLSQVNSLNSMFFNAESFNQNINHWDVSNVADMSAMFMSTDLFNQPLDNWDVSNVINMEKMFFLAKDFNQNINIWDVSNVTNMSEMFYEAGLFNQPLNEWEVSNVTNMMSMFFEASSFNQPLNNWDVSNVQTMEKMFANTASFDQNINTWDITGLTNIEGMFSGTDSFNQPLDNWDVSNLTSLKELFEAADAFNQPLDNWDVSNVVNLNEMFRATDVFNQSLNTWDVSNAVDMVRVFSNAISFNQPLDNWDVSNVQTMRRMFTSAIAFNQNINNWDVSSVQNMQAMFLFADAFNQPLDNWDVSNVTNMSSMFQSADAFNQNINNWNVSNVTDMDTMFYNTDSFNQPLNNWDVSSVTDMGGMFGNTEVFNQPLNNWDVSNVVFFDTVQIETGIFEEAKAFDQDLSSWNFSTATLINFIKDSGMSPQNYDFLLGKLFELGLENGVLGAHNVAYCNSFSKQLLLNKGWQITDAGLSNACDLNTISGTVIYDINNDGCDTNDFPIQNFMVNIDNGFNQANFNLDNNGTYSASVLPGNYEVTVVDVDGLFNPTPLSHSVSFTGQNEIEDDIDFCVTVDQQLEDLAVVIMPLEDAIPGFATIYQVIVSNQGTQAVSNVQVDFVYDSNLQSFSSATETPVGNIADLLTFNFSSLNPFAQDVVEITMINAVPPTLIGGEIISLSAQVSPDANDANLDNNLFALEQTVVNSYDPNDKLAVQGDEILTEDTDQYLNYRIRFQNLGTANALNVKITDTIDINLDWTTFQPITSSHDYRIEIVDGEQINYYFDNINLPFETADPEGSNGYITYKIKPKPTVQIGDTFENTAYIYFDFNLPIITNTVVTTVVDNLDVNNFDFSRIDIYPNPVRDKLNINLPSDLQLISIELFDIRGKLVKSFENQTELDFSRLQQGTYILKLNTDRGIYHYKIIKE